MKKSLHAAGEPLSMKGLTKATLQLRPDASKRSVISYVNQCPDLFVRAGRGKVALVVWNLNVPKSPARKNIRCSTADFLAAVDLVRDGRNRILLLDLVKGVAELTGQAEGTVRLRLKTLDGLREKDMPGGRGNLVCFTGEELRPLEETVPTQRERIQKTVRKVLETSSIRFERKKDLLEEVNRKLPCKRPTFYSYLREMSEFHEDCHARNSFLP